MRGQQGNSASGSWRSNRDYGERAIGMMATTAANDYFCTPRSPAQAPESASTFFTARRNHREDLVDSARDSRAAFMTARSRGNESELETAREMETSRDWQLETARNTLSGFDTDYMTTYEPGTSRTSDAFEGDLEAGAQRPGAPAYDAPTYQSNSMTEPRSTKVGNPRGTARLSYRRHYEETLDRPPCSSSGRETGDVSQGQTHWPPKIAGERVSYSTRKKQQLDRPQPASSSPHEGHFAFRQGAVEDVFSYARHNRVEDVERMLSQGIPADVRDAHGNTILLVACQNGLKRVLKTALRRGADVNATNARGNTALHYCFAFGYGQTLGKYLMGKGADATVRNCSGLVCYDGIDH